MNTDKKPPKPAFLNLNVPSLGEAEESGCDVSLGPHNLCPSVVLLNPMSKIIKRLYPEVIRKTAARYRKRGLRIPTFKELRHDRRSATH